MDISEVREHAATVTGVREQRRDGRGEADAIRAAITAAWELQRR